MLLQVRTGMALIVANAVPAILENANSATGSQLKKKERNAARYANGTDSQKGREVFLWSRRVQKR